MCVRGKNDVVGCVETAGDHVWLTQHLYVASDIS